MASCSAVRADRSAGGRAVARSRGRRGSARTAPARARTPATGSIGGPSGAEHRQVRLALGDLTGDHMRRLLGVGGHLDRDLPAGPQRLRPLADHAGDDPAPTAGWRLRARDRSRPPSSTRRCRRTRSERWPTCARPSCRASPASCRCRPSRRRPVAWPRAPSAPPARSRDRRLDRSDHGRSAPTRSWNACARSAANRRYCSGFQSAMTCIVLVCNCDVSSFEALSASSMEYGLTTRPGAQTSGEKEATWR